MMVRTLECIEDINYPFPPEAISNQTYFVRHQVNSFVLYIEEYSKHDFRFAATCSGQRTGEDDALRMGHSQTKIHIRRRRYVDQC